MKTLGETFISFTKQQHKIIYLCLDKVERMKFADEANVDLS